jgi:hypothetical protein
MSVRDYRNWSDFLDDLASPWSQLPSTSWTYKGQWVDPEKYDVVPKESYKKILIEAKQKELDLIEETKKRIEKELKELKG